MYTYTLKDCVEVGYTGETNRGGTLYYEVQTDLSRPEELFKKVEKIIDRLDHCIVTNDKNVASISERFFLLSSLSSFFPDILFIILEMFYSEDILVNITSLKLTLGKVEFKVENPGNMITPVTKKIIDSKYEG